MTRAYLQIVAGVRVGEKFPLPETMPFVIGRKKGDLLLPDPQVSGVHARILFRDGAFVLQDLNSTNGVYVNEEKVGERELQDNDVVFLGKKGTVKIIYHQ